MVRDRETGACSGTDGYPRALICHHNEVVTYHVVLLCLLRRPSAQERERAWQWCGPLVREMSVAFAEIPSFSFPPRKCIYLVLHSRIEFAVKL